MPDVDIVLDDASLCITREHVNMTAWIEARRICTLASPYCRKYATCSATIVYTGYTLFIIV